MAPTHKKVGPTVSKDAASYASRDAIAEYLLLLDKLALWRRGWRLLVLVLALVGVSLGLVGVSSPWDTVEISYPYDSAAGLSLDLAGCDAALVPGTPARVSVEAKRDIADAIVWTGDGDKTAVQVHNTKRPCSEAPLGVCASWCRVVVTVPSAPGDVEVASSDFVFSQPAGDASHPTVTIGRVQVGSISTSSTTEPLPSLSFSLLSTQVKNGVRLKLIEGSVHAKNADLEGDVKIAISGGGSVMMHDVPANLVPASFRIGQPAGLVSIATDASDGRIQMAASASTCTVGDAYDAATTGNLTATLRSRYDTNGDTFVSTSEFTAEAGKLACCGPSAPHLLVWCGGRESL